MTNKINPDYQKAIEQIKIDADAYANKQMKSVYANQKDNRDELYKYIGLLYITYAVDGLLNVSQSIKNKIKSDLNSKLKDMAKNMANTEVDKVSSILKHNYTDVYYKNAFVMDSGLKINLKFDLLKKEYIDKAVQNPIDGELFSSRIWNNKVLVADKVKQSIMDALNGNVTIDKLGSQIKNIFNVSAYESQRLVNTENTRVQAQAIDDIGLNSGVTQQMWNATLEANTCPECAELDGKYYSINDPAKPECPLHPFCRCLYVNVPFDGWQPTVRKDNESKDIIDYQFYKEWADNKGINIDS